MPEAEFHPGDPAPASGVFEELNIFGTPTGRTAQVEIGEPLPTAPVGVGWVLVVRDLPSEESNR